MPMYTSNNGAGVLTPEQVTSLLVEPVTRDSVAAQVTTVLSTSAHSLSMPKLTEDVSAAWLAEGAEITPSDATFDELTIVPAKVAGLTIISRELANDSSPAAAQLVGDSLKRSIVEKVDTAFFGDLAAPAPKGLGALDDDDVILVVTDHSGLDAFAQAVSDAEQVGATITSWVTHPATALRYAMLKEGDGSNRALLGTDPTQPAQRTIEGRPLLTSQHCPEGNVYGIPEARAFTVIREDAVVEQSADAYFSSDRIAVRAIMRVAFGFPSPQAIVRLGDIAG